MTIPLIAHQQYIFSNLKTHTMYKITGLPGSTLCGDFWDGSERGGMYWVNPQCTIISNSSNGSSVPAHWCRDCWDGIKWGGINRVHLTWVFISKSQRGHKFLLIGTDLDGRCGACWDYSERGGINRVHPSWSFTSISQRGYKSLLISAKLAEMIVKEVI